MCIIMACGLEEIPYFHVTDLTYVNDKRTTIRSGECCCYQVAVFDNGKAKIRDLYLAKA